MPRHVARGAKAVGAKTLHPGQPPEDSQHQLVKIENCPSSNSSNTFFEAAEIIQYQFCLQSNSTTTIDSIDHNISIIILHPLRGSCDISSPLVALDPRRHDISAPLPQQARPLLRWSIVELRLRVKELQPRREIGVFNCLNGPTSNSRRLSCTRKEDGCLMCVSDSANVNSYNHSRIVLYWCCWSQPHAIWQPLASFLTSACKQNGNEWDDVASTDFPHPSSQSMMHSISSYLAGMVSRRQVSCKWTGANMRCQGPLLAMLPWGSTSHPDNQRSTSVVSAPFEAEWYKS